jgi:hypothetical protein
MVKERKKNQQTKKAEDRPRPVRLPGFITKEDVGLGDVIKRVTSTFGIRACDRCQRRAEALNRWLVFTGRHRT